MVVALEVSCMALQYDLAPLSGRTSLIPFGAARRELKFSRARTIQPLRVSPPALALPRLPPPQLTAPADAAPNLEDLWRAIEAVPAPAALIGPPPFQSARARPSPAGAALMVAIWRRRLVAGGLSVVAGIGLALDPTASIAWFAAGVGGAYLAGALPKRAAEIAQTARDIEAQFLKELEHWWDRCSSARFVEAKAQLGTARANLARLAVEEQSRIATLTEPRRAEQLERHLRRLPLGSDKIKGVGPRRLARLSAYGVESAYDVTASRVSSVPGIGPVTTQALLSWRNRMEGLFVSAPKTSRRDRSQIALIKDEIVQRGAPLREQLQDGPRRLADLAASIAMRREALGALLEELHDRSLQAAADLRICGKRPTPLPTSPTSGALAKSLATRRAVAEWRSSLVYAPA
jgi:DNA-binding helix-hairpin-helix protein with protein kinase domain